ncbi:MAG: SIS domain-containing protein [Candidatus Cloacimonetes bacterium]|nr:SIS domain-containing protein [Candidatus Cloacimonadota bacterium]
MMKAINRILTRITKIPPITLHIPLPGVGCGVLGLMLAKVHINMGKYAAKLLKSLEYRGYDSTGAIFQDDKKNTVLLKDVGAPSTLVETLGIEEQAGKIFCGQVRWATFGAVDKKNSQPHEVRCKRHIFGAHNGNITNTRELKNFLITEGHNVVSDNDGEILVHTIEHYFDIFLDEHEEAEQNDTVVRKNAMRKAIIKAIEITVGSFASVIVDPVTEIMYAIKAGSSLYFGIGKIEDTPFSLASSDLTAVLKFTKQLVKLREGEFAEYTASNYRIFAYKDGKIRKVGQPDEIITKGQEIKRLPVRSKLRAEDTELMPPFKYFMEQEIYSEIDSAGKLVKIFLGGSNTGRRMLNLLDSEEMMTVFKTLSDKLLKLEKFPLQEKAFDKFCTSPQADSFFDEVKKNYPILFAELVKRDFEKKYFFSSEKNLFIDLIGEKFDKKRLLVSKALDSIVEKEDVLEFDNVVENFIDLLEKTEQRKGQIYTVACGTSFHATKLGAVFFNEIASQTIIPILPGDFRGQYSHSIRSGDVIIGVSQSGETKDLIDIFNDIEASEQNISRVTIVNNINSTLGQEKCDISIPIFCGPEIAVPATKSFINQLVILFYLALKTAEHKAEKMKAALMSINEDKATEAEWEAYNQQRITFMTLEKEVNRRYKKLLMLPELLRETIETTKESITFVASKIYMEPSMHILATKLSGVAKEGALKIRETVLNHCEGGEASEFKHGPNTILGKNTIFGMKSIKAMLKNFNKTITDMESKEMEYNITHSEMREIIKALTSYIFTRTFPFNLTPDATRLFKDTVHNYDFFNPLYRSYPLIYVTGPDERDVNLTISQINTHKIRGADTFVIAEDSDKLMENACSNPHQENQYYGWGYIALPQTGDSLMTSFTSSVALQLLALQMSIRKMAYLDRLGVSEHGVHPDVPKNVSKSITVD